MQGQLLLLVTDMGFLNEFGHVWETMEDVSGDGYFLNTLFEPYPSDHTPYLSNRTLSKPAVSEVNKL